MFHSSADADYVNIFLFMPEIAAVVAGKCVFSAASSGANVIDHLTADGTGFAGGELAVVALLEAYADFPWCRTNLKQVENSPDLVSPC